MHVQTNFEIEIIGVTQPEGSMTKQEIELVDTQHAKFGQPEETGIDEQESNIRKIIDGLKAENKIIQHPEDEHDLPTFFNTLIEFVSDTEANHRSYWQIISGVGGGQFSVVNVGYYDDVVVKQNGQWLIKTRNIPD